MAKLCPFRKASWVPTPPDPDPEDPTFDPEDGSWLWVTRPPYNATGNGTTNDRAAIQACINAAASAGKKVYLPAGTYHMIASGGTGLSIPSNTTIRGVGETSALQLYDDGTDDRNALLDVAGKSNIAVKNLKLTGTQTNKAASVQLIWASGVQGLAISGVTFDKGEYALRTTTASPWASGILVDGCTTLTGVLNPFYLSYCTNVTITGGNFEANRVDCIPSRWPHHFYVAGQVSGLMVSDCTLSGGQHWSICLGDADSSSTDLTFKNIIMTDITVAIHVSGYNGSLLLDGITGSTTRYRESHPWLILYDASGVTLRNFGFTGMASNNNWLVQSNNSSGNLLQDGIITNCTLLDHTPPGSEVVSGSAPVYDNVIVSATGSGGTVVNYTP